MGAQRLEVSAHEQTDSLHAVCMGVCGWVYLETLRFNSVEKQNIIVEATPS